MDKITGMFTWDESKERENIRKHGVDFKIASRAFLDTKRKIYVDSGHSEHEERFFCIGKAGNKVMTVRFTYRQGMIRIIGAGYWRKGKAYYEKED
ncbi:MAG: BrnT family toxin [Candidatus Omnitrophota bacterium]